MNPKQTVCVVNAFLIFLAEDKDHVHDLVNKAIKIRVPEKGGIILITERLSAFQE
jgi:hypothetical protein